MSIRKRNPRREGEPIAIDDRCLAGWPLPLPGDDADKEARGRLLVVGGSRELAGAVLLAATAALRAGAGKVTIATARSVAYAIVGALPEARVLSLDETHDGGLVLDDAMLEQRYDAVLAGPGMQDESATVALVARVVARWPAIPIVLDARAMDFIRERRDDDARLLVTPHAGELAHLTGLDKSEIVTDRVQAARRFAHEWRVTMALKGATTIVADPDGHAWRHDGGNIGLAVSGSGDVLAGLAAGLCARGAAIEQAAVWGVALHARAGDRLAGRLGRLGFLARELPGEVPALMHELSGTQR